MKSLLRKTLLVIALIPVCVAQLIAQPETYHHYTANDGLSFLIISSIYRDSKGYLWCGGYGGLNKFDGQTFLRYGHNKGLSNYNVKDICEDNTGNLWVGTTKGLNKITNDKIENYFLQHGLVSNEIVNICCDTNNVVWILTSSGVNYYYKNKIRLPFLTTGVTRHIACSNNTLYLSTDKGVFAFHYDVQKNDSEVVFSQAQQLSTANCFKSYLVGNKLYILEDNLVIVHDLLSQNKQAIESTRNKKIRQLINSCDNEIWMGSEAGLFKLINNKIEKQEVDLYQNSNNISSLFSDFEGNIWIGTSNGIYRYRGSQFKIYTERDGLQNSAVYPVKRGPKDFLWFGTLNGLHYFDGKTFSVFQHPNFKGKMVLSLHYLYNDLYIGTDKGLNIYDGQNVTFKSGTSLGLGNDSVTCIANKYKNELWLGGKNKVVRMKEMKVEKVFNLSTKQQGDVWNLFFDSQKRLWVGGYPDMGLMMIENDTLLDYSERYKLENQTILAMVEDNNNNIFAGTFDGVYIIQRNKVKYLREANGLSSDFIYTLGFDSDSNFLWVGNNQGLDKVNINAYLKDGVSEISHFGKEEGFFPLETNSYGFYRDTDNSIWFGTVNGLVHYNALPGSQHKNKNFTYIESIKIDYTDTTLTDKVVLPYYCNNLSFNFISIDFINPNKVTYSYKLTGLTNEWSPFTTQRYASFPKLSPGKYSFEVRSRNNEGVISTTAAPFSFTIRPPFWRTWWFYSLSALLVTLTIYVLVRRRVKSIRQKSLMKQQIIESELKALRSQINPHFLFNSLNSIQAFILRNQKEEANKYLAQFARLIRQILNHSRAEQITLKDEISLLENYIGMELLRFEGKFTYKLDVDAGVNISTAIINPMIIQPFVENAIIHGLTQDNDVGLLTISFKQHDGKLACIIDDDGIGIEASLQNKKEKIKHNAVGMEVTRERISALNRMSTEKILLEVEDRKNIDGTSGTRVKIIFPNAFATEKRN